MKMEKQKFRIGELAHQLGLERFVIRFWEKEFNFEPRRSDGGQRYYTEHDVRHFSLIKDLLYNQGLTIAGAKKILDTKNPALYLASSITTLKSTPKKIIPLQKAQPEHIHTHLHELKHKLLLLRKLL